VSIHIGLRTPSECLAWLLNQTVLHRWITQLSDRVNAERECEEAIRREMRLLRSEEFLPIHSWIASP
jgi:hypothetical protein